MGEHRWGNAILGSTEHNFSNSLHKWVGRAHTREKPLQASLVTFFANDLGTECPYSGIIREDLREGRCEEGTDCDQTKDVQDTELWGSPWVRSAPKGGKMYPASNAYVGEHNRSPHVKDDLVTRDTISLPFSQNGPDTRETWSTQSNPWTCHRRLQKVF